jgi:hypothetical protein
MMFITMFVGPIGFDNIGWYFWLWVIAGSVVAVIFVFLLSGNGAQNSGTSRLFVDTKSAGLRSNFERSGEIVETWNEKGAVEMSEVSLTWAG